MGLNGVNLHFTIKENIKLISAGRKQGQKCLLNCSRYPAA